MLRRFLKPMIKVPLRRSMREFAGKTSVDVKHIGLRLSIVETHSALHFILSFFYCILKEIANSFASLMSIMENVALKT